MKKIFSSILLITISLLTMAQTSNSRQWQKVDSLENLGQPQSALKIITEIYNQSKTQGNSGEMLKALLYKIKLEAAYQENSFQSAIAFAHKEVETAQEPVKQVLNSILGNLYWDYYQNNSWQINQRTPLAGNLSPDIDTWDTRRFVEVCTNYYLESVSGAELLQTIPLKQFEAILAEIKDSRIFRPTLYDFLVFRAINFFSDERASVTQPANVFRIDNPGYFAQAEEFVKMNIATDNQESFDFLALKLYHNVLENNLGKPENKVPYVDADLARLQFVYNKSIVPGKDDLYQEALQKLYSKYTGDTVSSEIAFVLASFIRQQGLKYNRLTSDDYKWKIKEALEIAEKNVAQFPETVGAKNCKVLINDIKVPFLNIIANSAVIPGEPSLTFLEYRNIDKVNIRILEVNYEAESKLADRDQEKLLDRYLKMKPKVSFSVDLPHDGDYQVHQTEIKLPALSPGYYVLLVSISSFDKSSEISWSQFWSTNISVINKTDNNGNSFHLLNRKTGLPLANVDVQLISQRYDYKSGTFTDRLISTIKPDKNGFYQFADKKPSTNERLVLKVIGKNDSYTSEPFWLWRIRDDQTKKPETITSFFTDRAIYRPGQTIYFKGIVYEKDGNHAEVKQKFKSEVVFTDVNGEVVAKQQLITNEFGSFAGSFTAPVGTLTGRMTISDSNGRASILVEEYKRPKFEVTFNPVEGSYKLGETVTVQGKAMTFAGSAVSEAKVTYRVVRKANFPIIWWGWRDRFPQTETMEITNGLTTTNNEGSFEISFTAIPDPAISEKLSPTFNYTVYADVSDINGETHGANTSVGVGYNALLISTDLADKVKSTDSLKLKIETTNLNGQPEKAKGSISITRIVKPDQVFFTRKWSQPDKFTMTREEFYKDFPGEVYGQDDDITNWEKGELIYNSEFSNSGTPSEIMLKQQTPGLYLLEIKADDSFGKEVVYTKYFNVFSTVAGKITETSPLVVTLLTPNAEPGETASLVIASPLKDARVMVEIHSQEIPLTRQYHTISNQQIRIDIPVIEEHRGNISVSVSLVYNNRLLYEEHVIVVPFSNKELEITMGSFRSKLEPGEEEEWQITIKGKKGEKVAAEFLAGMYDASLETFAHHSWPISLFNFLYDIPNWNPDAGFSTRHGIKMWRDMNYGTTIWKDYEEMIWYVGYRYGGLRLKMAKQSMMITGVTGFREEAAEMSMTDAAAPVVNETDMESDDIVVGYGTIKAEDTPTQTESQPLKIRSDFNETAFFFPQLATNDAGDIVIKFKMPESLTRWNFMGLAHTTDLKTGTISKSLETRKELMVFPNVPRFLREGDQISLSAKISNVSEEPLQGWAELQLFDAFTMQPVDLQFGLLYPEKEISIPAGGNISVSWPVKVPEGVQAVVYRMLAKTGKYSDGEEAPLPILPNRMMVTESLPLPVRGLSAKQFAFDKLLQSEQPGSTLRNYKLTLEYTSNPAWYAVQALPYLMEYPYECSEQVFSRLYANSIASHIANSDPKIKRVFDAWRIISPDALKSNLEKNEELKSVLIEETPWVRQADNETERKQRIALLFDFNRMASEQQKAMLKLRDLQKDNGGWPWFPGMRESQYITQHIVAGLGRMARMGIISPPKDPEMNKMVKSAIQFIDKEMLKSYEELKKNSKNNLSDNYLHHGAIHYLFARTYFADGFPFDDSLMEMKEFYTSQIVKYWNGNNNYMKAMAALVLNRLGENKTAQLIMRSLSETALHNEEMGMYWRNNPRGWFWYEAPVETQSLIIEAYDEVLNDTTAVEELKVWLLKQKQVQDWKTTRATSDAVYALLMRGPSVLTSDTPVSIKVGKENVIPGALDGVKPEAGTGYFKTSWDAAQIEPQMGKVEVKNPNKNIAWGAMYWQYFEQLDKITPAETPLSLEKELFVEVNSPTGPELKPVTSESPIKVGDKIVVRVILRSDRDMEYIHLKDMRASAFEPVNVLSGYRWQGGLGYYEATRDASTNFFIDYLPKGTYVFEYRLHATQKGDFSNGITSVQSMYAPEFAAHSEGIRVVVE